MPERQREDATHIVRGHVKAVYSAERQMSVEQIDTMYLIEIEVNRLDKGNGPKVDEPLYVRCWKSKDRPGGFKGPAGQTAIPRVGDAVWVYFRLNRDGGYDLIEPDGIQVFRETKA
jgi:hypothetical protein